MRQSSHSGIPRRREGPKLRVRDQQLRFQRNHHRPDVQVPLAGGVVLQEPEAEYENQVVHGHLTELGQNPGLLHPVRHTAAEIRQEHFGQQTQGKGPTHVLLLQFRVPGPPQPDALRVAKRLASQPVPPVSAGKRG